MEEKKEDKKPILQRALSGFKNLVSSSKSESYVIEVSPASSPSSSEPQLTRSTSSTASEEDTLRISNILLQHGVDPVNQYVRAQNAILDRNKAEFLGALSKIPTQALKDTLHHQWQTFCEQEPLSEYSPPSRPANVASLNIAIVQAAQEIWEEIYESRKSNKKRVPRLDLSIVQSLDDSSTSTTTDESSQEKPEVIYTSVALKPSATGLPLKPAAASVPKGPIIIEGSFLRCSNMKKEKDKKTGSP